MNEATRNEEGMVYRGREDRVHIADGKRAGFGEAVAEYLTDAIRSGARRFGALPAEVYGYFDDKGKWNPPLQLCPGCYMTAMFNALVTLAKQNGQSLTELGNTMSAEFARLAAGGSDRIESVHVILDDTKEAEAVRAGMARYLDGIY